MNRARPVVALWSVSYAGARQVTSACQGGLRKEEKMDYLVGCFIGMLVMFIFSALVIKYLNKIHKKEINHLQKYIDEWRKK